MQPHSHPGVVLTFSTEKSMKEGRLVYFRFPPCLPKCSPISPGELTDPVFSLPFLPTPVCTVGGDCRRPGVGGHGIPVSHGSSCMDFP